MTRFQFWAAVAAVCLAGQNLHAEKGEQWDRNVDRAALVAQQQAIKKYRALVKEYARTNEERALRIRLLEAMEEATNLEFRIAHGEAHLRKQPVDLAKYRASLKQVIEVATHVISMSPMAEDVPRLYFLRAQAWSELNNKATASKDYEFIAAKFPKTGWAVRSNLALAGFATDAGRHGQAIVYLKKVEEFPDDPHYPFGLYQLAWSYYNLSDVPTALGYLRRHITYYKKKRADSENGTLGVSEAATLDHSLKDVVTFYFDGLNKKISGYTVTDALPTFRAIEDGPYLGTMCILFAKLMRSRELIDSLNEWQTIVLANEAKRPEAMEVVMVNVEALYLRKSWDKVVDAAQGFKYLDQKSDGAIRKLESYAGAQKLILDVAGALQKTIASTKSAETNQKLSRILAGVYETFTAIVEDSDPRVGQIHYNLAETLFNIKDFDYATREYVWVLKHWQSKTSLKKSEVSLKAIASRYESLDAKKTFPKALEPRKLSESAKPDLSDFEAPVGEWIGWVDEYLDDHGRGAKSYLGFEFEANRLLYSKGQTRAAIKRMLDTVKAAPETAVATSSASLILDTYVFDKQWELLLEVSELFLEMPKLGDAAFKKRLAGLPADASFKLVEMSYEAKAYDKVLAQAERFTKKYATSPRLPECLFIASRAADLSGDKEKSVFYLTTLLTKFPKSENRALALLARASIEDAQFDFDAAAKDYDDYLTSAGNAKDRLTIQKRLLIVNWLSLKPRTPDCRAMNGSEELAEECDRYNALIALANGASPYNPSELIKRSLYSTKANRALWSAVALTLGGKTIGFKDRLSIAESLAVNSKDLDPLILFTLVPVLNRALPEAYATTRRALPGIASLKSSTDSLPRRIELIKHFETTAAKVVGLPWARIKISVLAEVAQAYDDFVAELNKLPTPQGISAEELAEYKKGVRDLVGPFREKGQSIRKQALELAAEFPVSPDDIAGWTPPAGVRRVAGKVEPIDVGLFEKSGQPRPDGDLFAKWEQAMKARAWGRIAFFAQQVKEHSRPSDAALATMRGIAFGVAGALPEALSELEAASAATTGTVASPLVPILNAQYLTSTAPGKAKVPAPTPEETK